MRKKDELNKKLDKQTKENIEELKEMGIHYVSEEEYEKHPEKYKHAIGVVPTYKPSRK